MPKCYQVIKRQIALDYSEAIVDELPGGQRPALKIRYRLPRRWPTVYLSEVELLVS